MLDQVPQLCNLKFLCSLLFVQNLHYKTPELIQLWTLHGEADSSLLQLLTIGEFRHESEMPYTKCAARMLCFRSHQYQISALSRYPSVLTRFRSDVGTLSHFCTISQNTTQTTGQSILAPGFYAYFTPPALVRKHLIQRKVRMMWRDKY